MGIVTRFKQKFQLTTLGGINTLASASGFPAGLTLLDSNSNMVTASGANGWCPMGGNIYHNPRFPVDLVALPPNTSRTLSWNFVLPFVGHLEFRSVFEVEYAAGTGTLQEFWVTPIIDVGGGDQYGMAQTIRFGSVASGIPA